MRQHFFHGLLFFQNPVLRAVVFQVNPEYYHQVFVLPALRDGCISCATFPAKDLTFAVHQSSYLFVSRARPVRPHPILQIGAVIIPEATLKVTLVFQAVVSIRCLSFVYFPIQKSENICPSKSSGVVSPTISPGAFKQERKSTARNSSPLD